MIEGYKTCYEQIKFDPQNALEDKRSDFNDIPLFYHSDDFCHL